MHDERLLILEEELLLVRHSGEIPEVALHSSLYYLQDDEEGPQLRLTAEEQQLLEQACTVLERSGLTDTRALLALAHQVVGRTH